MEKADNYVAKFDGTSWSELGGNNSLIISEEANLDNALKAAVFGAVGTAGQRCTTTRRLIIQDSVYDKFPSKLVKIYEQLKNGNIKIFNDIGIKSSCSFILKISGIWETFSNYGLTYKFVKVD